MGFDEKKRKEGSCPDIGAIKLIRRVSIEGGREVVGGRDG